MNTMTKIQNKGQVTIPTRVREQAGLSKGDMVEFSFKHGKIVITPKLVIDRSRFPNADDEYTPEQRRIIDARLDKADEGVKAGRVHGPFTAKEAGAYIELMAKERAAAAKKNRPKRSAR